MDGGRYFAIRKRLGAVVRGISEIARWRGIDDSALVGPGSASAGRPLVLAVIGETNSGKSSLLNSLFGRAVCRVDALPDRGPAVWYGKSRPAELPPGMSWSEMPQDGRLEGFEWFEAPGLNGMNRDAHKELLGWCAGADGILVVIHRSNPWEPTTWDMLARFDEPMLDRTLVVLQQVDRGDPVDLPVLKNHLRELALRKIGREVPVVPVSAAGAWSAWGDQGELERGKWRSSGFEALEQAIRSRICETPERFEEVRGWWSKAVEVLRATEERIEEGARSVEGEGRFIADVETELDFAREKLVEALEPGVGGFDRAAQRIRGWFSRRLGLLPSFVRCLAGDHSGARLDHLVVKECAAAARLQAESDIDWIEGECARLWEGIEPRARDRLALDVGGFGPVKEQLASARERFIERCAGAVAARAAELRPGSLLVEDLRSRQRMLGGLFGVLLVLATVAGTAGAMDHPVIAWWTLGVAGILGIATSIVGWTSRRMVLRQLDDLLFDGLAGIGPRVHDKRVDEVRGYFARFGRTFDPLRRTVARSRGDLEPMLEQWNGLFLELQAVGQEIG